VKPEDLLHRRFALASVNGKEFVVDNPEGSPGVDWERRPSIEFNEGFRIVAKIGNTLRGLGELKDGKLLTELLAATRMMPPGELGDLERQFIAMLAAGADITLSEHGTHLTLSQGEMVLVYTRADWVR
jgi:heat shock protein HslJ